MALYAPVIVATEKIGARECCRECWADAVMDKLLQAAIDCFGVPFK